MPFATALRFATAYSGRTGLENKRDCGGTSTAAGHGRAAIIRPAWPVLVQEIRALHRATRRGSRGGDGRRIGAQLNARVVHTELVQDVIGELPRRLHLVGVLERLDGLPGL